MKALIHESDNKGKIWHSRMGHLHYKDLMMVQRMVTSFPKIWVEGDGVCKGCVLGKQSKNAYPHSETRFKFVLDLVHSDICGPMFVTLIT